MAKGVAYRKLPGHRRGIFRGASIWLGPDHLLLVRSMRFREEYKRYQLHDIQAIVTAGARRFHISTRTIGIAVLWLTAALVLWNRAVWVPASMWTVAAGLVLAWVCVSWFFSCRCRIFTAVSRDDLPSLYRTWTVRRFLREVEPRIAAVQGTVQGWAEEIEHRQIGPADRQGFSSVAPPPKPGAPARARTLASDFLIACLFADAIWNSLGLNTPRWLQGTGPALALLITLAAIVVIVQRHRGTITAAMQKLAIAVLIAVGILYYVRPLVVGMIVGAAASASKQATAAAFMATAPWMRTVEAALTALLGVAGLAIVLAGGSEEKPQIITPSS